MLEKENGLGWDGCGGSNECNPDNWKQPTGRPMKQSAIIIVFIILLVFDPGFLPAQSTFEFILEYPVRKSSSMALEEENGDIIAIVNERTGVDYSPSSSTRSYLLKFNSVGDTATFNYTFGDTLFNFHLINRAYNGGYLLAGNAITPDSAQLYLILVRTDCNLNKVWVKYHDMTSYWTFGISKVFKLNNKFLIAMEPAPDWPLSLFYFQLTWFDTLGNFVNSHQHLIKTHGPSDYMLNGDSTRIWAFSPMYKDGNNLPARLVFDTTPQFIDYSTRPFGDWYTTVLWHTDSTFLLTAEALRPNYAGSHDRDMWIISYDSLLNESHSNYFGTYDTLDMTGIRRNIDFRHPDTVYFAGWKHQNIGKPPPGRVSWIMTGQTDAQLQPRYLHFIGGDYYYETLYILATKDGGSLICARRFNHDTQVYDPVFLKLNNEGLLVGTNNPDIQQRMSLLYPNPAYDEVVLETYLDEAIIKVFDLNGSMVGQYSGVKGKNTINLSGLSAGVYVVSLYSKGKFIENHKLIKNQ